MLPELTVPPCFPAFFLAFPEDFLFVDGLVTSLDAGLEPAGAGDFDLDELFAACVEFVRELSPGALGFLGVTIREKGVNRQVRFADDV